MNVYKIISGAQTGADRAAHDVALDLGYVIGGWVPKGRKDENGEIPAKYTNLRETDSEAVNERTRLNVIDSDGTLIFSHGDLTGGSEYTYQVASKRNKPVLHIDLNQMSFKHASNSIKSWLDSEEIQILNVAGPRASQDSNIYNAVHSILTEVLLCQNSFSKTDVKNHS